MTTPINEADKIFLGGAEVDAVYSGDIKVWPTALPVPPYNGTWWEDRPTDWLPITILPGDQAVQVLVHVARDRIGPVDATAYFTCEGAYTVDWGDGSAVRSYASGVSAFHEYNIADLAGNPTTSTGAAQALITVTPQAGQTLTVWKGRDYDDDGIVEIINASPTMVTLGSDLDKWEDSQVRHVGTITPIRPAAASQFRGMMQLTAITGDMGNYAGTTDFSYMFYYCNALTTYPVLDTTSGTNFAGMFYYNSFSDLSAVPWLDTSNGTNFAEMFAACYSLTSIPLLDTSNGTNFSGMFQNCDTLTTIPLLDTSSGTNFSKMFYGCDALTDAAATLPLLDTSSGTNFSYMFAYCPSLISIPPFNTPNGADFSYMFINCGTLTTIPLLNTSSGINFFYMFYGCNSLTNAAATLPLLDTSNGTDFSYMFAYCLSLTSIPAFNTSKGVNFQAMFMEDPVLVTGPTLDTSSGRHFSYMFKECTALASIPTYATGNGEGFSEMFLGTSLTSCPALDMSKGIQFINTFESDFSSVLAFGMRYDVHFSYCPLDAAALNTIFTNLGIADNTSSQRGIFITGCPGAATCDRSIATAKGWVVSG